MRAKTNALLLTMVVATGIALSALAGDADELAARAATSSQADVQVFTLAGLELAGDPEFTAFVRAHPADAGKVLAQRFNRYHPAIRRETTSVYKTVFNERELAALAAFYETPEGRSIASKTTDLYARLAVVGGKYSHLAFEQPSAH